MNNIVSNVLKKMEEDNIEYTVLRGFIPIAEIDTSKDVDIFVPSKYRKSVNVFFKNLGWYKQKINCSRFPHEQYIYLTEYGVKKIDIVYGLYYGMELYKYKIQDDILKYTRKVEGINVLDFVTVIELFILHICFDKKQLSEKNRKYLELMNQELINSKTQENINDNLFIDIANKLLNGKCETNNIKQYRKEIIQKNYLEYSATRHHYKKFTLKCKNYLRTFIKILRKRNICIIGVDGSGKSTTVEELNKIFEDHTKVQYMGFKDYESKLAKKHFNKRKGNGLYIIKSIFIQWYDMVYRYIKCRYKNEFIIFDRFPTEAIINFNGVAKFLAFILYGILFPKPKKLFYLYCSVETSFSRKDDIENKERFKKMKQEFDNKFLKNKKVRSFSTDEVSTEVIIKNIINDLNIKYLKYFI